MHYRFFVFDFIDNQRMRAEGKREKRDKFVNISHCIKIEKCEKFILF